MPNESSVAPIEDGGVSDEGQKVGTEEVGKMVKDVQYTSWKDR